MKIKEEVAFMSILFRDIKYLTNSTLPDLQAQCNNVKSNSTS